jgi:hypothetical protein
MAERTLPAARDGKLVQASDVLGTFDTEAEAGLAGLDWARAWIDSHD